MDASWKYVYAPEAIVIVVGTTADVHMQMQFRLSEISPLTHKRDQWETSVLSRAVHNTIF